MKALCKNASASAGENALFAALFLFCIIASRSASATTIHAINSGDWDETSTWNCGCLPASADDVIIEGYKVTVSSATGTVTVASISITNATGRGTSELKVENDAILNVTGTFSMTAYNQDEKVSFKTDDEAVVNIGGNFSALRTFDNNEAEKLKIKMKKSSAVHVAGDMSFIYFNSSELEQSEEIILEDSSFLDVSGNVFLQIAGGQSFECMLYNSSEFSVGGGFILIQSGGNQTDFTLGDSSYFHTAGSASFIVFGGDMEMRVATDYNAVFRTGNNCNLISTFASKDLKLDLKGFQFVGDSLNFSAQGADDITLDLKSNATLELGGIITRNGGYGILKMDSGALLRYAGSSGIQQLAANEGTESDTFEFSNIEINNTSGQPLLLEGPVSLTGHMTLTNGVVRSDTTNVLMINSGSSDPGNANSYVDGPMRKTGSGDFVFPLGNGSVWAPIEISDPGSNGDLTAQYFHTAYTGPGALSGELQSISAVEYWTLDRLDGNDVKVTLHWKDAAQSGITSLPGLRVAHFNGGAWHSEGNDATSGGTGSGVAGNIRSLTISDFSPFTFGSIYSNCPTAAFDTATVNCLYFEFADSSTGAILSWYWDFGDGDTSALQNPAHIYLAGGNYTVQLIVGANNSGSICYDTTSMNITAVDCPEICNNSLDDDGDGFADCLDTECALTGAGFIAGDESVCEGYDPALISSAAPATGSPNDTLLYQWEYSNDALTWADVSAATAETHDPGIINQTTYFRRGAFWAVCTNRIYSNTATKAVDENITSAGSISGGENSCGSFDPALIGSSSVPSGGSGAVEYRWQQKHPGSGWTVIAGATGPIYDPLPIGQTTWFRRQAKTATCDIASCCTGNWLSSNVVIKNVWANYTDGGTIAGDESATGPYNPVTIENLMPPNGGRGPVYEFQWEKNTGSGWQEIPGASSLDYNPAVISQTTQYRRKARRGTCAAWLYSNIVTKTVL